MVSVSVFLVSFLIIAAGIPADCINCFECVSPGLRKNWQLVGYPVIPDVDVTADSACINEQKVATVAKACNTFCITFHMEALDDKGEIKKDPTSPEVSELWTLRGCHNKLMGNSVQSQVTFTDSGTAGQTTIGTITAFTNTSTDIKPKVYLQVCNKVPSSNPPPACNKDSATVDCPSSSETFCLQEDDVPGTKLDCNLVSPTKSAQCQGLFCTKYDVTNNGRRVITKGCSSINPFIPRKTTYSGPGVTGEKSTFCSYYMKTEYMPPGGQSLWSGTNCYCNDQDRLCNGSSQRKAVALPVALFLAVFYHIFF